RLLACWASPPRSASNAGPGLWSAPKIGGAGCRRSAGSPRWCRRRPSDPVASPPGTRKDDPSLFIAEKPDYLPRPLPPDADLKLQQRLKDSDSSVALGLYL